MTTMTTMVFIVDANMVGNFAISCDYSTIANFTMLTFITVIALITVFAISTIHYTTVTIAAFCGVIIRFYYSCDHSSSCCFRCSGSCY